MTNRVTMGFRFRYQIRHVDMTLDTYLDQSCELMPEDMEASHKDNVNARIFKRTDGERNYSASELFDHYLSETGRSLESFIPNREAKKAASTGKAEFDHKIPITFKTTPFHISTIRGDIAIKQLALIVRFTLVPTSH